MIWTSSRAGSVRPPQFLVHLTFKNMLIAIMHLKAMLRCSKPTKKIPTLLRLQYTVFNRGTSHMENWTSPSLGSRVVTNDSSSSPLAWIILYNLLYLFIHLQKELQFCIDPTDSLLLSKRLSSVHYDDTYIIQSKKARGENVIHIKTSDMKDNQSQSVQNNDPSSNSVNNDDVSVGKFVLHLVLEISWKFF